MSGFFPSGISVSVKTVAPAISGKCCAQIKYNLLGATAFSPFLKCEVESSKPCLARVKATYARRISSMDLRAFQSSLNLSSASFKFLFVERFAKLILGNCEKSPRKLTGIDPAFLIQLSDLRPVLGKLRSAKPGTATKSHSAPFAA